MPNFEVKPLKEAGWEYVLLYSLGTGHWIDPKTKQTYQTEEALLIQKERSNAD